MPVAGVVDALERIHAALADGGIVVDTQPISAEPPVVDDRGALGVLDMREWAETIAAVDERMMEAVGQGLFRVEDSRQIVVTDEYDDLAELVRVTSGWEGTSVPATLADQVGTQRGRARVRQDVRVRLLSRLA